ncbi:MAG: hybrid sensor histidine kinase/response regulator [Pleurocapsa sp. MO_226.B13]|nr:hybrid sensor histidine kinase/response regulator [Pleurocapsa sp. MO_226.B13]
MSLNPDIRDRAYQFFIEEAQELLQVLETGLLEIREDHSTSKVHELMRAAHSIKGGAASVELSAIELLAHRLEDFFKALYSDSVEFDAELEGLLLQGYDCLAHPLSEQIETGTFDAETALLTAEPVFAALETRLEEALKNADNYIPSSNDLGVDIVSSIFEVDVVQAIEHLQTVAANPTAYNPAEELEGTLEMFAGFAELFNLPGFSDIVQTAQTALAQNPHSILEIIKASIASFTKATEQVLAGDRQQGGEVSPALRELAQSLANEAFSSNAEEIFAFEASADEEANLWSDTPALDPLTEDVFGNIPDAAPVEEEEVEAETSDSSDNLDDVFGSIPDLETPETEAAETVVAQSDSNDEPNLALDDVFGNISDAPPVGEVEAETSDSSDNLDDVFGSIPDLETPEVEAAEPVVAQSDSNDEPNLALDDVFGNIPDAAPVAEVEASDSNENLDEVLGSIPDLETPEVAETVVAQSDSNDEPNLALDDVFGTIPDAAPVAEVETDDTRSLTDKTTNQPDAKSENIADAVRSIEKIFDRLPDLETAPASLSTQKTSKKPSQPAQPAKTKSSKSQPTTAKLSVKVDLDRLERMNNLVGELTINRNSLALQNEQLQGSVSELGQKFFRFREIAQKLREISDNMLLERSQSLSNSLTPASHRGQSTSNLDESTEFDVLEMDSYSGLYASIQSVLEEIVQLEESVDDITIFAKQSDRTIDSQRQMLSQMRDELMWVRMLPLDKILQRFPRTLRDLSHKYQKPVELKLTNTEVLVDKAVLEKLSDPLLHLLRNGFDHGIEAPDVRTSKGKPATGKIEIHAYYQGNQTVIEVKDDGKGLDVEKIAQKAIEKGLISDREAAKATKERLYDLIFEPGFSTKNQVSEISGRGVGMNIVRSQIETLKGKITVTSSPGEGSIFTLRLPLTLTIAKLLVCSLGSTSFAIPSDSIEEIVIPTKAQIKTSERQKFLLFQDKLIPIYALKEVLQYNCPVPDTDSSSRAFKTIPQPDDWYAPLLILRRGQKLFALEVVSLISEQELVIKPYGKAIAAPQYSYGCTILGNGSLIPAFDGAALISTILGEEVISPLSPVDFASEIAELATKETAEGDTEEEPTSQQPINTTKTIMVVDDSTALRRTMALTLEKQGYRVIQKKDGRDALEGFRQNPELDLIICDVEMPTMNGFEFLGMRRRDSKLSQIPTFMLTSRSGVKHRNLATQLGADGYFTKPYIEPEFVAEVKKILESDCYFIPNTTSKSTAVEKKTVLIIDDSSALRLTLALSLENKGYRVLQGRDGAEGLELLRNNLQTNLVICDVEMPNMNGFEFLTARRKEPNLTKIPVIMLSSRSSDKHRALANNLGAIGYFTKPYVEEKFLQDVDSLIQKFNQN